MTTVTTIIAIPGIMSDSRTWGPIAARLTSVSAEVFHVNTVLDATLETMAASALAESDGGLVVLAHSMGARVAMEMGRQAPQRIRAMVLANANAEGPGANEAAVRETRIAQANLDMGAYARAWLPKVMCAASMRIPDLVTKVRQMVEDCPTEIHERQNRALLVRPDATKYLATFGFPVLLLTGSEDHLSTVSVNEEMAALLRDVEFVTINDAGHLLPFEQPEQLLDVIQDWLTRKRFFLRD